MARASSAAGAALGAALVVYGWVAPAAAASRTAELGAELGYAIPAGNVERGSRVSDLSFGLAGFGLDAAYRLRPPWSVGAFAAFAASIPTLCGSGSECVSSLGHDFTLGLLGRWHVGQWHRVAPELELSLGYEWFGTKLVDNGVASSRSFRGPRLALGLHGPISLSRAFSVGPALELAGGVFTRASLDAPGVRTTGATEGSLVHLWLSAALRASLAW